MNMNSYPSHSFSPQIQTQIGRAEQKTTEEQQKSNENETETAIAKENADDDDDELEDEEGWITPNPIKEKKIRADKKEEQEKISASVACATDDFAMQNVLLHKGIAVINSFGFHIKELKNFVLRCHACYHIVHQLEKQFCPSCGRNTLIKTSYSINEDGDVKIYLKRNYQYNNRGTIYALPKPLNGRDSGLLIQCEDQKEYRAALRKSKGKERDFLDPDFVYERDERRETKTRSVKIGHGKKNVNEVYNPRK